MWFKTRVGLASVMEPTEILIARYDWGGGERWGVYALLRAQSEAEVSGLFGKGKFKNPTSYLAFFMGGEDVQREIGECPSADRAFHPRRGAAVRPQRCRLGGRLEEHLEPGEVAAVTVIAVSGTSACAA